VAWRVYLDASALAKRYAAETGTAAVNHLFRRVPRRDMLCLTLGTLEVLSIFVRKKNANVIPLAVFHQAVADFRSEILSAPDVTKVAAADVLVYAAIPLVEAHSINSNDAVLLRSALELAAHLRPGGDDLILVASDRRLLGAALAEGLRTFDPENQTEAELDALLGP
jgi:predicted nucleic acid-binding protein